MRKKEVLYAVVGGVVGAVLVMAAGSFSLLGAHKEGEDAKFGEIICRELKVVRPDGQTAVSISFGHYDISGDVGSMYIGEYGGQVFVFDRHGELSTGIGFDEHGGRVDVRGKGESQAYMGIDGHGGFVHALGKGELRAYMGIGERGGVVEVCGTDGLSGVDMGINEYGGGIVSLESKNGKTSVASGSVSVFGKDGRGGVLLSALESGGRVDLVGLRNTMGGYPSLVSMGIEGDGGYVSVSGKDDKSSAGMRIDEHGGVIGVHGKGESQAVMGINEYGNGVISMWDKDGYRLK